MKIYLGADHAGFYAKEALKKYFTKHNIPFIDLGNKKYEATDDYPDFGKKVAKAVKENINNRGILFCSSGQGMCMVANKFLGIRAALGYSVKTTKKSREHNNSNILCLSALDLSQEQSIKIVSVWLRTPFSKLIRHKRRIKKINRN